MPSASGQSRVPASWKNGERRCSRHLVCVCTQYEFARCTLIAQSPVARNRADWFAMPSRSGRPTGAGRPVETPRLPNQRTRCADGHVPPAAECHHSLTWMSGRSVTHAMGTFPGLPGARRGDHALVWNPGWFSNVDLYDDPTLPFGPFVEELRKQRGSSCGTNGERDLSRAGPFLGAVRRRRTVLSRASRPSVGFDPPIRSTNTEVRSKALG